MIQDIAKYGARKMRGMIGDGRAADLHHFQVLKRASRSLRVVRQSAEHCRHNKQVTNPLVLQYLERFFRVKVIEQHINPAR